MPQVTKSKPNYVLSLVLCLAYIGPAQAREQWQMQHPAGPAPTGPVSSGSLCQQHHRPQ